MGEKIARRKFNRILMVLTVSGFIGALVAFFAIKFALYELSLLKTNDVSDVVVEIPYGSSLKKVSHLLAEAKVISFELPFYWFLRFGHKRVKQIQAGYYEFDGRLNYASLADRLLTGTDQSFKLTFVEGQTLNDLAASLEGMGLVSKAQFIEAMKSDKITSFIDWPFVKNRQTLYNDVGGLEGYLFPDTYFFSHKDSAEHIIKTMYKKLVDKLDESIQARLREQTLSLHEVLTLASIVEKETGKESERPVIASVYLNRLRLGMRLQADPTVIYGMKDYSGKIRKTDLSLDHPYNTYRNKGLPPSPIAAPSLAAIKAVLWPAQTSYLYFVSKNDGSHFFCENLACHNDAVRTWQVNFFKRRNP